MRFKTPEIPQAESLRLRHRGDGVQPVLHAIYTRDLLERRCDYVLADAEQTAIAEVLSDMDAELAALEQRRDKTRALKQAMMQELLTGKIRFV